MLKVDPGLDPKLDVQLKTEPRVGAKAACVTGQPGCKIPRLLWPFDIVLHDCDNLS